MEIIDAIILGVIQGLTEFLPVSSSGHLELGKAILGESKMPAEGLMFTVVVHFATALSTMLVYRKDIAEILIGLFKFKWNQETQFAVKIFISMIPAGIVGLAFEKQLETLFGGSVVFVGFMLILTALLLFMADKAKNTNQPVTFLKAFQIGIAQAIAILPGISRSGATISASVILGVDKSKAARFSFLMVVPLILGKIVKDIMDGAISMETEGIGYLTAGFLAAFISGVLACTWMVQLVRKSKLSYFSIYCLIIGVMVIVSGLYL